MLPLSNDTLLRLVRRRGTPGFVPPAVVGIDDWTWRRNQRYGTIICDLERRRPPTGVHDGSARKSLELLPPRIPLDSKISNELNIYRDAAELEKLRDAARAGRVARHPLQARWIDWRNCAGTRAESLPAL